LSNDQNSALGVAITFVIGAAAGYIVGILFAPASGRKTRQKIQEEINKTGEKAKETYDKIAKEAEKGIKVLSSHLKT
jgi:gas vesicle protein